MMPRMISGRHCALLLLLLGVASCHRSQVTPSQWASARVQTNQAAIVGRITSSRDASPLASALVRLLTPGGGLVDSARADHAGAFVLGPTSPGVYRLEFRMIVHRPLSMTRELHAGSIDTLKVRLTYDETAVVSDCIGAERPDGTRRFGSQFCRPE